MFQYITQSFLFVNLDQISEKSWKKHPTLNTDTEPSALAAKKSGEDFPAEETLDLRSQIASL
jgi:hypothetical protein